MNPSEDFSRYTTIIPEEHLPPLSRNLRKIPDFSWLLDQPHPEVDRLQGDFIRDFPTLVLGGDARPRCQNFTVMILNNTCDLPNDRLDFITAAPVVDFGKYLEFERAKRLSTKGGLTENERSKIEEGLHGYANSIRRNEKTEILFVPRFASFENGALVLLHLVCSVASSVYYDAVKGGKRVGSFTQTGFYFLLIKLTTHLARAESHEVSRVEGG